MYLELELIAFLINLFLNSLFFMLHLVSDPLKDLALLHVSFFFLILLVIQNVLALQEWIRIINLFSFPNFLSIGILSSCAFSSGSSSRAIFFSSAWIDKTMSFILYSKANVVFSQLEHVALFSCNIQIKNKTHWHILLCYLKDIQFFARIYFNCFAHSLRETSNFLNGSKTSLNLLTKLLNTAQLLCLKEMHVGKCR